MKDKVTLEGLDKVMKNLNDEIKKIEGFTMAGLIRAVILIRRDMEFTSPKVPVDLRNLDASFFTVTIRGATGTGTFKGADAGEMAADHAKVKAVVLREIEKIKTPVIVFGFSANYATWVHENIGATFKRPGSGPKFLEAAIKRNQGKILQIIAKSAER